MMTSTVYVQYQCQIGLMFISEREKGYEAVISKVIHIQAYTSYVHICTYCIYIYRLIQNPVYKVDAHVLY